ncbi:MAG TPA: ABC transporter permease [Verrucomicrobiae bacterium]|nr:ABC transporter permease [Verrucomicrobiae bacterium]
MNTLMQDLKYAVRVLAKSPGFTAIAVLTLALGIGANTAIFSILHAVVLESLPVKNPQQLVLFEWNPDKPHPPSSQTGNDGDLSFSYPAFNELHRGNASLSSIFAWVPLGFDPQNTTVGIDGEPTLANGMMVTGEYFSGLGVLPILGRAIIETDENKGAPRVAVISYGYWSRQFSRRPDVIGRRVTLNGIPATIVGVMPPSFYGVDPQAAPDLWMAFWDNPKLRPWSSEPYQTNSVFTSRRWIAINIMGRLKPGVTVAQATSSLDVVFRHYLLEDWQPAQKGDFTHLSLAPADRGLYYLRRQFANPLYILMGAVGFVLLIACANLATLLLARASARWKEITVRLAIGASRWRLIRQLLTESVLMALIGGALGVLLADWGTQGLVALISGQAMLGVSADIKPNLTVLLFAFAASVLTGIIFGVVPAFRATRIELASSLKQNASNVTGGRDKNRLAKLLVSAQVAASVVLLIAAGLFVRTLINMQNRNFGFDQSNLVLFGLDATRDGYSGQRLTDFYGQALARIQSLPGVQSASMLEYKPFSGVANNNTPQIVGSKRNANDTLVRFFTVSPGFFATMRIPVLLGRGIDQTDTLSSEKVAVVNDLFVKEFLSGENPIGKQIAGLWNPYEFKIVGVVRDAELTDAHAKPLAKAYLSYKQLPEALTSMYFAVRASGPPVGLISAIRDTVHRMDSQMPMLGLITQREQTAYQFTQEKLFAQLSSFFGVLALLLAIIGLYGTMGYSVTRKTHEIGIRMALGANPANVLSMVLRQGMILTLTGLALGVLAALVATHIIASMIFGVSPYDALTFAIVAAALFLVALVACYIPARRAMRVDPIVALRHQ